MREGEDKPPRARSSRTRVSYAIQSVGRDGNVHTFQVRRLLLAESCAGLADARGQRYFEIPRHNLLTLAGTAFPLGALAQHGVDALDRLLTALEPAGNFLRQTLYFALLALLYVLVVEAWKYMLLVQLVQAFCLLCDVLQPLRHLVLNVQPARRQHVHLDDGIAVVVVVEGGHEPAALVGEGGIVGIAIRGAAVEGFSLGRVVRVGLAVGYEAGNEVSMDGRGAGKLGCNGQVGAVAPHGLGGGGGREGLNRQRVQRIAVSGGIWESGSSGAVGAGAASHAGRGGRSSLAWAVVAAAVSGLAT